MAIWDNRASQYYAIHDFYLAERRMMRATIVGDKPFKFRQPFEAKSGRDVKAIRRF